MQSYRPEELFDATGKLEAELAALAPQGDAAHERQSARQRRRCCCAICGCPISAITPSTVPSPGAVEAEATRVQGSSSAT